MAQILTPPASRHGSESPDAESKQSPADSSVDLSQSLDILLERYLCLLDRHQKLQADLATTLSAGFLSLAQANYNCPPGRRYGADYYDERMKATRRVNLESSTSSIQNVEESSLEDTLYKPINRDDLRCIFTIGSVAGDVADEQSESTGEYNQSKSSDASTSERTSSEEKSTPKTEDTTPSSESSEIPATADSVSEPLKQKPRSSDPIRWYGILVSPFLRRAQKSFTEAVGGPLPELASVVVEMQAVEEEVKRLRCEIDQS